MEKSSIILFCILYLLLTTGIQVAEHTCGGETTADIMPLAAEDPCGCGDMAEQNRCCTIEVVTIRVDDAQRVVKPPRPAPLSELVGVPAPRTAPVVSAIHPVPVPEASPPPTTSLSILHCTFLI